MLFGKYRFQCELQTDAVLPYYKGSTFRGLFGHALKRVVCALKRQECATCLLKRQCLYSVVFENGFASAVPQGATVSSAPHAFVLEPPSEGKTHYAPGDALECSLLLFGEVNVKLPYFVYAFQQMGRIGMGKRVNGTRGRFVLSRVRSGDRVIYTASDQTLDCSNAWKTVSGTELSQTCAQRDSRPSRLRVVLETPLRIKFQNRLKAELPFHVLVRAMLRRISSLFNAYGDGEPDLDYRGLVERANTVEIAENKLGWFDWKRYSNRQEQKMYMGGMVGSVTYEGPVGEYLPLLRLCEKVHVGKGTSFGLGRMRI